MISLFITLVLIGFILWLVLTFVPLAEPFPRVITVVAGIIALFIILGFFFPGVIPRYQNYAVIVR